MSLFILHFDRILTTFWPYFDTLATLWDYCTFFSMGQKCSKRKYLATYYYTGVMHPINLRHTAFSKLDFLTLQGRPNFILWFCHLQLMKEFMSSTRMEAYFPAPFIWVLHILYYLCKLFCTFFAHFYWIWELAGSFFVDFLVSRDFVAPQ